jgi:hypothetical protein
MAFIEKTWVTGDKITADLLNRLEQVILDHDTNISNVLNNIGDLSTLTTSNKKIADAINELKSSVGSSSSTDMTFNTLADLQTAYPNGTTQPAWVVADNEWYYWSGTVSQPADTTAPVITASSNGGTFSSAQTVTLSVNETSTIYYTLDGSTPTISSSIYSSAITINSTSTLKFFGKDTSGNSSTVQSVSFTITGVDTTPPTITINPVAGTYTGTQSVTLSANETSTIYYTLDGSTPTTSSSVYSAPISVSASETIKYFGVDSAGNNSVVQTANYTINVDTTPPVITASPAAGSYSSSQSVTLSSNETGSTIYYTTNGTTPTTSSTVYSSPITISATTTLQFIGKDALGNISTPVAATYTINSLTNIVSDSFNRADSTTNMGNADTGQTWVQGNAASQPMGIISNQAYMSTGTNGAAWIESGKADVNVKITLPVVPSSSNVHNILTRVTDASNYYMIQNNGTAILLYKRVSGTYTQIGSSIPYTTLINDVMEVDLSGSTITLKMSGTQKGQWTDSTYTTQTKHGFLLGTTSGRVDDFIIQG